MSRIADLIAEGPTLSFEFFPPKTDVGAKNLDAALDDLAKLQPSFVSVTYGGGGSTRDRTRELVVDFNARHPFPAMPHLTCVGQTREELRTLLESYRAAGIDNVLALAGDPPLDGSDPGGDFQYATELIELIREVGDFSIGVAAFPELHPRSESREVDRRMLAEKLDMADYAITQFFFEMEHFTRLVDELAALGCDKPVIPGVMPFANVAGVRRMSQMNGTHIPDALNQRLEEAIDDPLAVRALGVEVAAEQCVALREAGAAGLHIYALNRVESIHDIDERIGLRRSNER